ncbi:hypothetical protein CMQ_7395 [Grosmannia clavigera kw1407]|uniref:25S rRNA adenine-N(1) methyltransferase n=1 Tax=Grosmannia clavigera (strain kw1407 / UAMH 11150) TaxID=655863 RepID=F0XPP8_GROCL|nr:uncharacterized protein CMQ_7395 [Grosmannia clavigera kw1407]EFX00393.1 hypothetical protein CMQ_7395 [Grosmannia clavigera kw1407]
MGATPRTRTSQRPKSLAAGRPPTARKPKSLSRKATKRLINTHHQLEKRRQQALALSDTKTAAHLEAEIESLGGLSKYQQASLQGQRRDRGGDSSRVLMQWLGVGESRTGVPKAPPAYLLESPLRMLEVGALSPDNACSASGCFQMERIDLNSQGPGILQQDFLQRPLPQSDAERFDVISLSLVLNYVPQQNYRGDMLLRCLDFLHEPGRVSTVVTTTATSGPASAIVEDADIGRLFPSVFMVLPEACVTNSRYLTEEKLTRMMNALGFDLLESKLSQRLVYYLWKRKRPRPSSIPSFSKKELRSGTTRNNFSIVLQGT